MQEGRESELAAGQIDPPVWVLGLSFSSKSATATTKYDVCPGLFAMLVSPDSSKKASIGSRHYLLRTVLRAS